MTIRYVSKIGMFANTVTVFHVDYEIGHTTTYGKIMACVMRCFCIQTKKEIINGREHYVCPKAWRALQDRIDEHCYEDSQSSSPKANSVFQKIKPTVKPLEPFPAPTLLPAPLPNPSTPPPAPTSPPASISSSSFSLSSSRSSYSSSSSGSSDSLSSSAVSISSSSKSSAPSNITILDAQ